MIVIFPLICLGLVERLACSSEKLEGVLAWVGLWLGESNVLVSVRLVWSIGRVGIFTGVLVCECPLPRGNEGALRFLSAIGGSAAAVQQLLRSLPTSNHVHVMIPMDNIIQSFINFYPFHPTTLSDVRIRHMRLRTNVPCRRLCRSDRRITAVPDLIVKTSARQYFEWTD